MISLEMVLEVVNIIMVQISTKLKQLSTKSFCTDYASEPIAFAGEMASRHISDNSNEDTWPFVAIIVTNFL
jgi:hypothetical protein